MNYMNPSGCLRIEGRLLKKHRRLALHRSRIVFTEEEKFTQWTNILKGLTTDAIAKQDEANRLYEAFRQSAGDMGFDVFSPDATREASQKTGITASQDSVDKIDGMVTTMMGHTYSINENVNRTANGIDSLLDYASSGLSLTTDIERTA